MPAAEHSLIDSHCHPHFPQLAGREESMLAEMAQNGVTGALAVATNLSEAAKVKAMAKANPQTIYAACGVHPLGEECEQDDEDAVIKCCTDDCVVAVGETGLDFFRGKDSEKMQRARFAAQISAARKLNKPLIIHTRDSLPETLDMLKAENARDAGGVLHCYTGDNDGIRKANDINFIVSFTGIVSFRNAGTMRDSARFVSADGYMVETDAPYLAPTPHRGKVCTPAMVKHVAEAVAQARNQTYQEVATQTTKTFTRLFLP